MKTQKRQKSDIYYIYILECENNILYTGIATDYKRRFLEHSRVSGEKKGAKFTKSHIPERIVAVWKTKTRSDASKLEAYIKKLPKEEKEKLVNDSESLVTYFRGIIDCRKFKKINIE